MRVAVAVILGLQIAATPAVADRIPPEKIRNPDPKAMASGIHFHSSITPARRKILVDDLAWLSRKGPIRGSGMLSRVVGAGGADVDGATLVAWLLDKISVVSDMSWDPRTSLVVLSGLAPERGIMIFSNPRNVAARTRAALGNAFGETLDYFEPWRVAREDQGEVDGIVVDGLVLPVPRSRSPSMPLARINLDLVQQETSGAAGRISRLNVLFHEATHIAYSSKHTQCRKAGLSVGGVRPFGTARIGSNLPSMDFDCDPFHYRSANVMSVAFLQAMAGACEACGPADALVMRQMLDGVSERVQTAVSKPFTIPAAGLSPEAGRAYAGRRLDTVPAIPWFDAVAAYLRAKWPDDDVARRDLALVRKAVESAVASGAVTLPWAEPRGPEGTPAGDVAAARAWIKRAEAGPVQPTLSGMPPCSQFAVAKTNLEENTPCGRPR